MEIERSELDLLAIYHSHPDGSCGLSQIDLENFFYPGVFSVLLFLEDDTWKIKAFRIGEKKADEITSHFYVNFVTIRYNRGFVSLQEY